MTKQQSRVLVLLHDEHEHLGLIENVLLEQQFAIETVRVDLAQEIPSTLDGFEGLILMGGPQSVYRENFFPLFKREKMLVLHAVNEGKPLLGVCLGCQIVASALGATVAAARSFELGWKPVRLSEDIANDYVLGSLPAEFTPLHWHGDIFDLPVGAKLLGSSELTSVQGFSYKDRVFGLLFHLEMQIDQINEMIKSFPEDVERGGEDPNSIADVAGSRLMQLRSHALEVFRRWSSLL